jgi:hypothetical protein
MKLSFKKILFVFPSLLLFVLALIFFTRDYQSFIGYLKNIEPEIYSLETIELSITQDRFSFMQALLLFITSSFLLLSLLFLKKAPSIANGSVFLIKRGKEYLVKCLVLFSKLTTFQKISIVIIF